MNIPQSVDENSYINFVSSLGSIKYKFLNCGSFRNVYDRKNFVVKVPKNKDGLLDNIVEAKAYLLYKDGPTDLGLYLAPCRLMSNFCLLMVKVNRETYYTDAQVPWAKQVDGRQIGSYKGKPVAFDYALNLSERMIFEKEIGEKSKFFNQEWESSDSKLLKLNREKLQEWELKNEIVQHLQRENLLGFNI